MPAEVLRFLRPTAGDVVVDCTLGGGGHAEIVLPCLRPGGRLIGLDVDGGELARTTDRLRGLGFGPDVFTPVHGDFRGLPNALAGAGVSAVQGVFVDLGVSSMQAASPARGFSYKVPGPLDMRFDPTRDETAADLLARSTETDLEAMLAAHADEPHAALIASLLKRAPLPTTQALERRVRLGLAGALPGIGKPALKTSVRRTFQALRIAVNDELAALDALLAFVPHVLAPGGRLVVLTFHSGEDRRVKQAYRAGARAGLFAAVSRTVTRSSKDETRANRRASSAKLRWAIRAR